MSRLTRRGAVPVLAIALALVASVAFAAWLALGSGAGTASAATMATVAKPSVINNNGSVVITWTAVSGPVDRYDVIRHDGATQTTVCSGVAATTCTDEHPVGRTVQYGVVSRVGAYWVGAESDLTSFTFDGTAPSTIANVSPAPNAAGWNKSAVNVHLDATDAGSGVDHITYTLDSAASSTSNSASVSVQVSGAGSHTLTYFAVDKAGNTETEHTLPVKIDPTAPTTQVSYVDSAGHAKATPDSWYNSDVTLNFSATDAGGSGVKSVTVNGSSTSGATASTKVSAEGLTSATYFATDNADNVEGTGTASVRIDKTKPDVSIAPASSSSWIRKASQQVTITASDTSGPSGANSGLATVYYVLDGDSQTTIVSGGSFTVGQGNHTVTYGAIDQAGNKTEKTATILVDSVAPSAQISPASSTSVWQTSNQVTLSATDPAPGSGIAGFLYAVNSNPQQDQASNGTYTFTLPEGTNSVKYSAYDAAGNSTGNATATIKVDTAAPALTPVPASGTTFAKNTWKTGGCAPSANSNKLCVTVDEAGSGVVTTGVTYTLARLSDANGTVVSCYSGGSWSSNCSGASMTWAGPSKQFQSPAIPTADLQPTATGATYYYQWTVAGVKDQAGNTTPATTYTFNVSN